MKNMILFVLSGVFSAVFAETTLPWVMEGYAENGPSKVETTATSAAIDTTVFVEVESEPIAFSTTAPGFLIIVR